MKIGVDSVLIGCWAGETGGKILDVGTGCGVISLILAQRFKDSYITGIDIDKSSVEEARENFRNSSWGNRLEAITGSFPKYLEKREETFDLIVSNPPYFNSGITHPESPREKARHQDTLSAETLLKESGRYLKKMGRLSLILPMEFEDQIIEKGVDSGWKLLRELKVRDNPKKEFKRIMLEFGREEDYRDYEPKIDKMTMFSNGEPTDKYRELCKEFYLKF